MSVAHTMAQMYKLDGWQNLRWKREINKNIPDAETPFFLFFSDKTSDEIPPSPPTSCHSSSQPPNQPGHNSVSVIINTMFSSSYSYFEKKLAKVLIHPAPNCISNIQFLLSLVPTANRANVGFAC